MRKRNSFLKAAGAACVLGLLIGGAVHESAAQTYVQRHWVAGIEAKKVEAPAWVTGFDLGQVNEGAAYSVQLQAANALSYSSASLPSGFSLSPTGFLSGTAPQVSASADYQITVAATNDGGNASRTFTLRVIDTSVPPPAWTSGAGSLGEFTEGDAVSIQLQASNGASFVLQSGALPAGLSLSSSGLISGVASEVEADTDYAFTIRAGNDGGHADRAFALRVKDVSTGKMVFSVVGTHSWTVPAGVTQITAKAWGAGGGGINATPRTQNGRGGGGGFATSILSVTPGQSLQILVGQGGAAAGSATIGGGGASSGSPSGGSGGGRSAVRNGSLDLLTGGGGGGASYDSNGGAAGGLTGQKAANTGIPVYCAGNGNDVNGGGGTQSAGGAPGTSYCNNNAINRGQAGSQYTGGAGAASGVYAGGGGGGWFGGAGGNYQGYNGSGGGGSSKGDSTLGGSGFTPGGNGDADYVAGVGVGGNVGATVGGNGLVVINW